MKKVLILLIGVVVFSSTAFAVNGKIKKVANYSYIEGIQLHWDDDYTSPTSCTSPGRMTVRGNDINGKNMMSMVFIAMTTGYQLNCTPKTGCSGINGNAVADYCVMTKD